MRVSKHIGILTLGLSSLFIFTGCSPKVYANNMVGGPWAAKGVRTHPIWPLRALALGQLTHEYLARLRIDYVAS